jgi:hypothetical protein
MKGARYFFSSFRVACQYFPICVELRVHSSLPGQQRRQQNKLFDSSQRVNGCMHRVCVIFINRERADYDPIGTGLRNASKRAGHSMGGPMSATDSTIAGVIMAEASSMESRTAHSCAISLVNPLRANMRLYAGREAYRASVRCAAAMALSRSGCRKTGMPVVIVSSARERSVLI